MSDMRQLYQEIILDHYKNPRNKGKLEPRDLTIRGTNPSCGDDFTFHFKFDPDGNVEKIMFEGHGCAISTCSTSLLTEIIPGKDKETAERIATLFRSYIRRETDKIKPEDMGELMALSGVRDQTSRVKCATLAWNTLITALTGKDIEDDDD